MGYMEPLSKVKPQYLHSDRIGVLKVYPMKGLIGTPSLSLQFGARSADVH